MLDRWLRTPEVRRWWGDPEREGCLLEEDLTDPEMVMRIVSFESRDFAYVQDFEVHVWPQPQFACLPMGSRAIDTFIGEADMIGRGHGAGYLRLLARRLRGEGAPGVAIDPDVKNHRARRAYRKAGFRDVGLVEAADGLAVLMLFDGYDRGETERFELP